MRRSCSSPGRLRAGLGIERSTPLAIATRGVIGVCAALATVQATIAVEDLPDFGGGFGLDASADRVSVSAEMVPAAEGGGRLLRVRAEIEPGWHLYAIDQPPGGPRATVIRVNDDSPWLPAGEFAADPPPESHEADDVPAWKGLELREHAGNVSWEVPLKANPASSGEKLEGSLTFQLCRATSCLPPETIPFTAVLGPAGTQSPPSPPVMHQPERGHVLFEAWFDRSAGTRRQLTVRLLPTDGWHLYPAASADTSDIGEGKPTLVSIAETRGYAVEEIRARAVQTATAEEAVELELQLRRVEETASVGSAGEAPDGIDLLVGYQTCRENACDPPFAVRIRGLLPDDGDPTLHFSSARYAEVAAAAAPISLPGTSTATAVEPPGPAGPGFSATALSLPVALAMGLAGGLILNLMPCVLPVLGLKLMAFAQQSGRARREVFEMNLWYVAGLFAVFFVLATASVAANVGLGASNLAWGEQFTSTKFNIVMASIVFAFALSFLGVWEIPIPGFIGERAGHVQSKEGPLGAFLKGVLSTVLATPCSGPFLGPVFGYTLSQPTSVTYAVFASIATGMALPYLLVGVFPSLIRFLPKPGAWMETVKEVMGFVMLGTVVFLFTFLEDDYLVPTLGLLFSIWAGCWWIGRGQTLAPTTPKTGRWIQAAGIAAALGGLSFSLLAPVESLIPWEPFSRARLASLREEGSTVLVDFSADWCMTCKLNLATAIETDAVKELLEENRVVPLLADWTEESAEIKMMLESLQSRSIPLLAIYPGCRPGEPMREPIVLRDLLTESQVLEAIREAGPSRQCDPEIRAASRP